MWELVRLDYAREKDHFIWLFSRLGDWKYGIWNEKKYIASFFRNHAQLWVDGFDQLLGFVLSEDGENIFFIFTRPGYEYLYGEILDWTIEDWGSRYPILKAEVHEFQGDALAQLEKRGFHSVGEVAKTRTYDLKAMPSAPVQLPAGLRIVNMVECADFRSKGLLFVNGFQDRSQVSELDLLKFEYSRESPAYDPNFDLSVVTEEGLHVATCVGFNDPAYGVAEVEKVCTHHAYRRRGLAEAVIRDCFRRLKQCGIERAYITGYSGEAIDLYEKLGPCNEKLWFHYELAMR